MTIYRTKNAAVLAANARWPGIGVSFLWLLANGWIESVEGGYVVRKGRDA